MAATGDRLRIRFDTINKMAAGQIERFFLLQMRDVAVAVVIRVMKFGEGVVMRRSHDPDIVNADFFARLQIVVHDHALRADDGHFTDFSWLKPAALNGCESLVWEEQRHVCHVLNARADMRVSLTVNRNWEFAENVQYDGNIVRRQIPSDIDVFLEQSQIQTPRVDVADLTQVSGLHDFGDFPHGSRVEECVVDHQDQPLALGDVDQFLTFGRRSRHWFFDERVLASQQARLSQRVMALYRSGDDNGVDIGPPRSLVLEW